MSKRIYSFGLAGALLAAAIVGPSMTAASATNPPAGAPSVDALKASDAELTKALADLDAQIAQQTVAVASAQQAIDSANQALSDDDASLQATQARLDVLSAQASDRAVEEYTEPRSDALTTVLASDGFAEASRRSALLEQVTGRDDESIGDLKAARAALDKKRKAVLAAQKLASDRRAAEGAKLDALNASKAEKTQLDQSLQDRIESYAAEDAAGAASSGSSSAGDRASRGGGGTDDSRISGAGLKWPVNGPIRSPFGPRWGTMHTGIDIGASEGTPIYAAKAGKVISAGWDSGGYGNLVRIDHGGGFQTWYAHQSRINVTAGTEVNQGDLIGWVGHTGHVVPNNVGAAHLHFETRVDNSPRNPMQYLP